jgi:glycine cleavage system aminomethyltransferase T
MTEVTAARRPRRSSTDELPLEPVMRSVVNRAHAAMGATFERRGTWTVPALYGSGEQEVAALSTSLGFADISARGKIHLSGAVDPLVRSLAGALLDPLATAPIKSGGLVARLGRDWALALLAPSAEADVMRSLEPMENGGAMATDVTSALSAFLVAGPRLDELLARTLTIDPADLASARCVATTWARIPAVLVTRDLPQPAVELYVGSDHGRYAWETLRRHAGTPVGWRAIESWGWRP